MMALEDVSVQNKDARIAELTTEVARYKAALEWIADDCNAPESVRAFARNALREGCDATRKVHGLRPSLECNRAQVLPVLREGEVMNESKVCVHRAYDLYPSTPVVTHADYKALEDECERLRAQIAEYKGPNTADGIPDALVSEPGDHPDASLYIKGWNDCRSAAKRGEG